MQGGRKVFGLERGSRPRSTSWVQKRVLLLLRELFDLILKFNGIRIFLINWWVYLGILVILMLVLNMKILKSELQIYLGLLYHLNKMINEERL